LRAQEGKTGGKKTQKERKYPTSGNDGGIEEMIICNQGGGKKRRFARDKIF
jgi:hypothetical protein